MLLAECSGDKCRARCGDLLYTSLVTPVQCPADAVSGALSRQIYIRHMLALQGNYLSAPPGVSPLGIPKGSFPYKIFLVLPASVSAEPSVPPQIESCKHKVYPAVKHPPLLHLHTETTSSLLFHFLLKSRPRRPITVHRQCCVTADQWRFWLAGIGSSLLSKLLLLL